MYRCWMTSFLLLSATSQFVAVFSENNTGGMAQKNAHEMDSTRHNILTAQFECYQKIMKDTNHNKTDGSGCKRTWDGWLCWDDLDAGFTSAQHCPDYYDNFDTSGFPLIPAFIHAVARSYYYNDNCWISSNTSLLYIIHGPICAALLVNLFFLLNIVRVLITKLKVTHQAESSLYMRAVRATLILVPLLGIQYLLLPYKPDGRLASEIFMPTMIILMHYQGLLVATIFCFFNSEVQGVLRRHWNQYRIQFANTEALRSASYAASSMTEVHRCYSIDSHMDTLNGKSFHSLETTILRSDSLYM
ncbi:calcitonin gene-related peptide type 1 receptor-like [Triplophysa rosa]|uniref:Calcitonin gene-related peptide type 1 receptor-like n=1 Tax=Triplophysa rosa TaxID=992332 RepID=A0A9W8C4F4_TRIRA|nr:calcitonin gene-related peptide type 1 receptor-like [Triplophysa rosa]